MLEQSCEVFGKSLDRKDISIECRHYLRDNTAVIANEFFLLNSVINNLMSNAIKFSLPGGKIILETYDNEDHAVIEIKDNGIGIPREMISHLFSVEKPTTRLGTAGEQGTGFGLPLASFLSIVLMER